MTTSKVVISDDVSAYERWELPVVNEKGRTDKKATAQELEDIQKQAYAEGFALGQKEGAEQKQQELQSRIDQLESVIQMLDEPLKELDEEIVLQLAQLAMTVAQQVVRREIKTHEGEIVGVVREAMSSLPASSRKISLHVHPEDAELVRNAFAVTQAHEDDEEMRWKIIEDPLLTRGGCIVSSENSRIDASVEGRLNRVIATFLGGERETDE